MWWVSLIQVFLVMGMAVSIFEYLMKRRSLESPEEQKALVMHFLVRLVVLGGAMLLLKHFFDSGPV